jgi:raffinose/stachyose/melibiose transport system permease protein
MLSPTLVLLSVFCLIPFLWAFVGSLYQYEIGGESQFVGARNYLDYFRDPTFWPSVGNMVFLTCCHVLITIVVPLTVAKLIFSLSSERARHWYRVVFLLPIVVPGVAVQMIWSGMIYSEDGFVNEFLRAIGLGGLAHGWLSSPHTVLPALVFVGFPWAGGISILIYYAGLANIPESVHEAAVLDGATGIKKFLTIDVPMVLSQIRLLVILTIIGGIQGFEGMLVMTRGGPGFRSMVPGLWMYYNAFSFQRMGYACAIGVVLFVAILFFTVINLRYMRTSEQVQGAA